MLSLSCCISVTADGTRLFATPSFGNLGAKVRELGPRRNVFDLGMGLSEVCSWMRPHGGAGGASFGNVPSIAGVTSERLVSEYCRGGQCCSEATAQLPRPLPLSEEARGSTTGSALGFPCSWFSLSTMKSRSFHRKEHPNQNNRVGGLSPWSLGRDLPWQHRNRGRDFSYPRRNTDPIYSAFFRQFYPRAMIPLQAFRPRILLPLPVWTRVRHHRECSRQISVSGSPVRQIRTVPSQGTLSPISSLRYQYPTQGTGSAPPG